MRTMEFKAAILGAGGEGELEDGEIVALVSVFNNVDSYGDVVMPGAFAKNLEEWGASGDPIPFIWAHDWADPFSHVGIVRHAEETSAGLKVRAYISPEERAENPKAAQVYKLLKSRRVKQFSFAFDVVDGGEGDRDGRFVYELRELKVHEVGPCLLGVNQETELIAAKAARLAASGQDLSGRARQDLEAARDRIDAALKGEPVPERCDPIDPPPADADGETSGQDGHQDADPDTPRVEDTGSAGSPEDNPASAETTKALRAAFLDAAGVNDQEDQP
jgi:uncharacterized protein